MMRLAGFLLVGLVITLALLPAAHAAPATSELSWTAPTTRVDGTPLAAGEILEYRVFYTVDGPIDENGEYVAVTGTSAAKTLTLDLIPRAEPYTVNFAVRTVSTDGLKSAQSETVSKTFQVDSTAAPNPPTNIQFTIVCGDGCTITEVGDN
jgi:hypothetical protein